MSHQQMIEPDGTSPQEPMAMAPNPSAAESGIAGILRQAEHRPPNLKPARADARPQSAHPAVLFCLFFFRTAAIALYVLCGLFTDNYVLSTVLVVLLLAMDFWNCRNVAGRRLVGLRFWNQVDDDGESCWVFESRDPSRPANPVDSRLFWIAIYAFPVCWALLFVVSIVRFNISFIPIVILALVFNITNAAGFTYADRDAKRRWANSVAASGWNMPGFGGNILWGVAKNAVGRAFA